MRTWHSETPQTRARSSRLWQDPLFQEFWNFWPAHFCSLYPAGWKCCIWPSSRPMWQPWLSLVSRVWALIAATLVALLEDDGSWCRCVVPLFLAGWIAGCFRHPLLPFQRFGKLLEGYSGEKWQHQTHGLELEPSWESWILWAWQPWTDLLFSWNLFCGEEHGGFRWWNEWWPGHCLCSLCSGQSAFLWL